MPESVGGDRGVVAEGASAPSAPAKGPSKPPPAPERPVRYVARRKFSARYNRTLLTVEAGADIDNIRFAEWAHQAGCPVQIVSED